MTKRTFLQRINGMLEEYVSQLTDDEKKIVDAGRKLSTKPELLTEKMHKLLNSKEPASNEWRLFKIGYALGNPQ
jgi:ABC-type molybdate transport system ATPase subunit